MIDILVQRNNICNLGENAKNISAIEEERAKTKFQRNNIVIQRVAKNKVLFMIISHDQNTVRTGNIKIPNLSFEKVGKFKYFGATPTNINDTREEIKRKINMGNAYYYSIIQENTLKLSVKDENMDSSSPFNKKLLFKESSGNLQTWSDEMDNDRESTANSARKAENPHDNVVLRRVIDVKTA
ncbi:hypothetical protein ANN_17461 [Periplaneta americana]|uniref:Uncharacterized protein n=1 Tax=Periplaneta americana TaxID=6978 RepID=A0ABQ8ST07_PERAM|nr:hypothetical protein ANN_17461 [Periplaneta americana]